MIDMKPKARTNDLVVQKFEKEVLVYDINTHKVACLNEISTKIWGVCNGVNTIKQIAELLSEETKRFIDEEIVKLALDQLFKHQLLENNGNLSIPLTGFTRRQAIRKIATNSLIVLPMISILVAPTATVAQSGACLAVLSPCDQNFSSQCCTGLCGNVSGGTTCCLDINASCTSPNECCTAACNNGVCGI